MERGRHGGASAIGRLVRRVPRIVVAYVAAALAAGLALGFLNLVTSPPSGGETFVQGLARALVVRGFLFGAFVVVYAALPALLLVLLAERFGWRRWPVHWRRRRSGSVRSAVPNRSCSNLGPGR